MSEDQVRMIAASSERLFELWTEPGELVKWWGPDGYDIQLRMMMWCMT